MTFAATARRSIYCGATPVFADILGPHDLSLDPEDVERGSRPRTKAVTVVHFAGYPAPVERAAGAVRRARARADRGRRARARRQRRRPDARHVRPRGRVQLLLEQGARRAARAACSPRTTTTSPALARSLRSQGMTLGLVEPLHRRDRHLRRASGWASTTASTSRAPRCCSRACGGSSATSQRRRELTRAYRAQARRRRRRSVVPYTDDGRRALDVLRHAGGGRRRGAPRRRAAPHARAPRRADVAASIPPCTSSRPTASASARRALPRTEHIARARDHDPAVPGDGRGRRRTASSTRSPRRCA